MDGGVVLQVGTGLFGAFSEKNFVIKSTDPTLKYYKVGGWSHSSSHSHR